MTKQINQLVDYSIDQAGQVINNQLNEYKNFMYDIVLDKEIINYADKITRKSELKMNEEYLNRLLTNYVNSSFDIRTIAYISGNNDYTVFEKDYFTHTASMFDDPDFRQKLYSDCTEREGISLISSRNMDTQNTDENYLFFLGMPVKDYVTKKAEGFMFIGIEEKTLASLISQREENKVGSNLLRSKNIIVDQNNLIVSHTNKKYIGRPFSEYLENEADYKYLIREAVIPNTEWNIIDIINSDQMLAEVHYNTKFTFIFGLCIMLLFFAIIIAIIRSYTKSISKISESIHSFGEGNMNTVIACESKDELFTIAHQFNKMAKRINLLVDTLKNKNISIQAAMDQKRKSELRALEAQINPHFIYNTLDMINWKAIHNHQDDISEMLSTLGSLLRYSISNIDMLVSLESEILWMKKYLYLQQMRFNYSFEYTYDISEDAMLFPIYKLLMQPIVENALLHGFEGIEKGGHLHITGKIIEDNKLFLEIKDDGNGMSTEVLSEITEYLNHITPFNGDHIGMKNIINRLNLYYDNKEIITINSAVGKGTSIQFILPYKNNY